MAQSNTFRRVIVGSALAVALATGSGVASAATQYGGTATGGVTITSGGTATFSGGGFASGQPITITVGFCGSTRTYFTTAADDGTFSLPVAGAGYTTFQATGSVDGVTRTVTASAVMSDACPASPAIDPTGNGGGGAGGGGGSGGSLPFTGFEAGIAGAIGLGAIGAGSIAIVASRRRRNPSAS